MAEIWFHVEHSLEIKPVKVIRWTRCTATLEGGQIVQRDGPYHGCYPSWTRARNKVIGVTAARVKAADTALGIAIEAQRKALLIPVHYRAKGR